MGLPAASIIRTRNAKPIEHIWDLTHIITDVSEKALTQVKRGGAEFMAPRMDEESATTLAEKLAGGTWTHDYALTADEAKSHGLPIRVDMPQAMLDLMKLYPQPVQSSAVEYLPIDLPRGRR